MMQPRDRIYVALDAKDPDTVMEMVVRLKGHVGGIKLGLEYFLANGPDGVRRVRDLDVPVFLDLKLHDIPNTVLKAMESLLPLLPGITTIHTAGGSEMMRCAADAAAKASQKVRVVGVTVLTSLDGGDLADIGVSAAPQDQVLKLAALAKSSGLDGIVCSPAEVAAVRDAMGPDFFLVVPGIRPAGSEMGDQKRVMTPAEAVAAGADVLVIGRPITGADDPVAAADAIAAEMEAEIGAGQ